MSAMANFTWRSLGANRVRTAVTIAGVALAAALLTAVLGTYTSLNHFLYQSEEILSGTWMACAELEDADASAAELEAAKTADNVVNFVTVQEVGFAALSDKQQDYLGDLAPIVSVQGDISALCAVEPSEGEMPTQPGEILLFETWKTREGVNIGDTLTFDVGQRELTMPEGEEDVTVSEESVELPRAYEVEVDADGEVVESTTYQPGMLLHVHDAYNASADGGVYDERLINTETRTYTVVGFYDRSPYAVSSAVGQSCLTVDDPVAPVPVNVYLSYSGMTSQDQVKSTTLDLFPDAGVTLHTALLRYMGVSGHGGIWQTFFGLVAILAIIIVVACVSLIYNAFAISVAERTGQFGLLSSIGASKRQLRRSILMEAGFVTLVGVPLGLLVGIGGCAVTFAILGPGISSSVMGPISVEFGLHLEAWALIFAALLTMVAVLASAFLPAVRMSRVSAIDAIRQAQTGRVSRGGIADARASAKPGKAWKRKGVAGRVFGMSGQLARINHKCSASKGRAASISLGLAVVLIMTAGSLNVWLSSLVSAASGSDMSDFSVSANFEDRQVDAQLMDDYAQAYESLLSVPGTIGLGWNARTALPILLPDQMVGASLTDGSIANTAGTLSEGVTATIAEVVFVDDASFDAYATSLGLDPAQFDGATQSDAKAIALAQSYGNNGQVYQLLTILNSPGTVQLAVSAQADGETADDVALYSLADREYLVEAGVPMEALASVDGATGGADGDATSADDAAGSTTSADPSAVMLGAYYFDDEDNLVYLDPEQTTYTFANIDVVALADTPPDSYGQGSGVVLLLPASVAGALDLGDKNPYFRAAFDQAPDTDLTSEEIAEALEDQMESAFDPLTQQSNPLFVSVSNLAAELESVTLLALIINVFCLLFAIILALIALANVFNTITNGLILRRREFAIMKSVGLSPRQFRRMIASECLGYSLRGLIPGVLISVVVSGLLFAAVSQSLSGMTFSVPWLYVLLAVGMVSVAMALSVAYGMHRCKADNIVEALRSEAR